MSEARPPTDAAPALFAGPGEIRARCRSIDWSATRLGPVEGWPESLRTTVRTCLNSRSPMSVWAGPELVLIYNDGYPPILGPVKHPWAIGRPAREVWAEFWDRLGPELERVIVRGESTLHDDEPFLLQRGRDEPEETFFSYSFTPIQEPDGRIVGALNVFAETTGRVHALGERQALYAAVFDSASDAVVVTDPLENGRVLSANPAACRMFGYTEEEFRGLDRARMLDADNPSLASMLEERDRSHRAAAVLSYVRKDGTRFRGEIQSTLFTDAQGRRLAVTIIRDVTERQRAEQAVLEEKARAEENKRRLEAVLETIPSAVVLIEASTLRFVYLNQRAMALYGVDYLGVDLQSHAARVGALRPDGTPFQLEELPVSISLRSAEPVRNVEMVIEHADGSRFPVLVSAAPLLDPDGMVEEVIAVFEEISERKKAELALLEADRRKNEFLGVLSHELRNPLAPIKNSLYVLERAVPGGEQARRAQMVVARQVDHLVRLVDDLLDVTRITRGRIRLQRARLELSELVRRTVDDYRPTFEHAGVRIALEPARGPLFVNGDESRLAQVIGNLLHNSVKFTPPDGRVIVTVDTDMDGKRATVRVADTGAGMPPEVVAHLFEPFMQADTTLDHSKGGLGLGLALVKGLVELHGGEVTAESSGPEHGSTFTVYLPLETQKEERQREERHDASPPRRRVLVIEDNHDAADSLRELLDLQGQTVEVAYSGREGVAKARSFMPDLVLCDIGLPGMDGYEVARVLRSDEVLRNVTLVAVSGYALPEDLQRAADAGFDRHLAKPPSVEKLAEILRQTRSELRSGA